MRKKNNIALQKLQRKQNKLNEKEIISDLGSYFKSSGR